MKRKVLIISNPGVVGEEDYLPGVIKDIANYESYLQSPMGGYWGSHEIEKLNRPTLNSVRKSVDNLKFYEYSMIIFTGHGHYNSEKRSTMCDLNEIDEINSSEFLVLDAKQTIILDCCRKPRSVRVFENELPKIVASQIGLNGDKCRKYYDDRIIACGAGVIILYACSIGEYSYDVSASGGCYSFNLIQVAKEMVSQDYSRIRYGSMISKIVSVVEAHDATVPRVRSLHANQNPQIEKPRSTPYFPFAVMA